MESETCLKRVKERNVRVVQKTRKKIFAIKSKSSAKKKKLRMKFQIKANVNNNRKTTQTAELLPTSNLQKESSLAASPDARNGCRALLALEVDVALWFHARSQGRKTWISASPTTAEKQNSGRDPKSEARNTTAGRIPTIATSRGRRRSLAFAKRKWSLAARSQK